MIVLIRKIRILPQEFQKLSPNSRIGNDSEQVIMEKVYGKHSVRAVFMNRPEDVRRVLLLATQKENLQEFADLAEAAGVEAEFLPWPKFLKTGDLSQDDKHQGVCIYAQKRTLYTEGDLPDLKDARLVLALDTISNPQNLGSILRSAAFFGVDAVLLIKNRNANVNSEVTRIAVGGAEFVKIYRIINLGRSLEKLKELGFWIYGLDERGEKTIAQTEFDPHTVLVVGAEGQGLRQKTGEKCDHLVSIPGGKPGIECLNAAVATAVALAEFYR